MPLRYLSAQRLDAPRNLGIGHERRELSIDISGKGGSELGAIEE
jgi:hypothetical protein